MNVHDDPVVFQVFACNCTVKLYDRNLKCGVVVLKGSGGITANCFFGGEVFPF